MGIFTTDGVAERVYLDTNADSAYNATELAAVAHFQQFSDTLYMSIDVSCETGLASVEPCLTKGDLIFITDANWGTAEQEVLKTESRASSAARARAPSRRATPTRRTSTP